MIQSIKYSKNKEANNTKLDRRVTLQHISNKTLFCSNKLISIYDQKLVSQYERIQFI